jgi:serine/threonine-protein kinase RsbW
MNVADADPAAPFETVVIPSDLQRAKETERVILRRIRACGFPEDHAFAVKLALEEALTNAIKHGNCFDASKTITVQYAVDACRVEIVITDQGGGFNPCDVPDPTTDENIQRPCGRGILLIRAYMSEVAYNETGNQIRMVKLNQS